MKITIATRHFFPSVQELFSKVSDNVVQMPKDYSNASEPFTTDLLVFTGGEDINPELYGSEYSTFYTEERDEWEWSLLYDSVRNKIKAKRIFGICRGLQVLNVFYGGTLVTDIHDFYGQEHSSVHPIMDFISTKGITNPFAEITMVNSMHHQGIARGGKDMQILSVEPKTRLPEIVTWGKNSLGMQFHPEFFDNSNPAKWRIAEIIAEWVDGKEFFPSLDRPSKRRLYVEEVIPEWPGKELDAFITSANQQEPSVTISVDSSAAVRWDNVSTNFEFQTIEQHLEENSTEESEE